MTLSLPPLPPAQRGRGVTAVLGPTNTGKTTLAIERMLAHPSGLIGLPLRLLAREVYAKLVARAGAGAVALVTGEEKIKPPGARYWVATVEAMPLDIDVSFLAIDEIQIAGDLERGHVFTDRILNRRGRDETMLLGAGTMRGLVEKLIPGINIVTRPRFSNLTFAGEKKITRLPRRSAIVAFSADEVYAIAELIRRQRGGAAVVLGALSPRTRNAQVELYQAGDVDYLIATDAIGMGLNLDVEHVAFASDRKFDGYQFRRLNPVEFAQIAGRAGRSNRDGTFGTTGRCPPLEDDLVQALESHSFEGIKVLQWRNAHLDFRSIDTLRDSLDVIPEEPGLTRSPIAIDQRVLELALRDPEVKERAVGREAVSRLWDACLMPDYRRISPASHADLVVTLYGYLTGRTARIPSDWIASQVAFADRTDGDIDTLSTRIAHIRTWTFAANRPDWVDDPVHWQAETRRVEDNLSDALHERLTQRFVDRRTSVLMRRLRENTMLEAEITKSGDVTVEGQHVGRLEGFRFAPDPQAGDGEAGKALRAAASKALAGEIDARAERLSSSGDEAFILSSDGTIRWHGEAVAKLVAGDKVLAPRVRILSDEHLTGGPRDQVQARLDLWVHAHIAKLLGPVQALEASPELTGLARGVAFQLAEAVGVIERPKVADDVKQLDQEARAVLRKLGVRFGAYHIYLPATLKPAPRALALQLYMLRHDMLEKKGLAELPALAASGRTSIAVDLEIEKDLYRLVGFRALGARAVRVDILERLADIIRPALAWRPGTPTPEPAGHFAGGGFTVTVSMTSLVGCSGEDFASILKGLGYRMEKRPAPPPKPAEPAPAAAEATPEASAETPTEGAEDAAVSVETVEEAVAADAVVETASEPAPAVEEVSAAPVDEAPATEVPAEDAVAAPLPDEAVVAEATEGAAAEAAAEPALVEVWRPGGRMDGERPQRRDFRRGGERGAEGEQRQGRPRHDRGQRGGQRNQGPREGQPAEAGAQGERRDGDRPRGERPQGDRPPGGRPPRRDFSKFGEARGKGPEGGRPPREDRRDQNRGPGIFQDRAPRKEKEPDPLSPFAKLAALKDAMTKKP
ncbi:helicase-related protein [Phreatobacter oligotrophus]|uniref:ATP-dependent RNA helicase SUPV3L1/SUV3 n=1 Tax=Phreatobacter oligotrophus TaxID=1122261 RepID=A0A2T4ZEV2_9HYPH|nr:helicase-related protein [Phreatobacter oligotrophus]PTM60422.1 ATP-dependent RNA helicase SUPV3L1/SUV3 [Phreatobacter oligotrophus]